MERTLSVEEKIRRAEEIYNRRNGENYTYSKKKEKKGPSLTYRLVKQIVICLIIYGIFYVVSNREYFLSDDFKMKVQSVAEQNETLNKIYNNCVTYLSKYFPQLKQEEQKKEEQKKEENKNTDENIVTESSIKENENIGGAEENVVIEQSEAQKSQEEIDVENIKNNVNFILPIEGKISSTFGWRNPTTASVPKYHTGLDIAANTGTVIKSATNGTVIMASSEEDYGKHYKIQINDIILVYAHCSKLYLKEGDTVTQGQEIAEVGSTGNSTGPHLHFEIRKEERLVDPQLILNI